MCSAGAAGVATDSTAKGVECSVAEGDWVAAACWEEQSSYSSHVPFSVSLNSKPMHQALCLLSAPLHECSQSVLVALRPALPLPSSWSANQWLKSWSATRRQREPLPWAAAAGAAACWDAGDWVAAACWEEQSSYSSHMPLSVSLNSKPMHQALCTLLGSWHACSQSAPVARRPTLPLPSSCSVKSRSKSWSATRRQRFGGAAAADDDDAPCCEPAVGGTAPAAWASAMACLAALRAAAASARARLVFSESTLRTVSISPSSFFLSVAVACACSPCTSLVSTWRMAFSATMTRACACVSAAWAERAALVDVDSAGSGEAETLR